MLKSSINHILEEGDSRYTYVMLISKRAREIQQGAEPLVDSVSEKPVSIAMQEVREGKITYELGN